ncbi:hypothetical protein ACOZDE_16140 [Streptomyces griseoincarnatus]
MVLLGAKCGGRTGPGRPARRDQRTQYGEHPSTKTQQNQLGRPVHIEH